LKQDSQLGRQTPLPQNPLLIKIEAFSFTVRGKVQGVFFRKHAVAEATKLELRGWIQNAPDGTVVGAAAGAPQPLASFKAWLSRGSPKARVDSVTMRAADAAVVGSGASFEVRAP
jgi:acylphosphatase